MRIVDSLLTRAGRSGSLAPAVKVAIGDVIFYNSDIDGTQTCRNTDTGLLWTTKPGNRIELVQTYEQPYGGEPNQKSQIVLNNADNFLTGLDFKGERVQIGWGAYTTKGKIYDNPPPFYVREQIRSEQPASQKVTLTLLGLTDWLGQDYAQCDYISTGTDTIYDLVTKVLEATIPPFDGDKKFNIIVDNAYDGVFDVVIPGPSFRIEQGRDTRATVLARLFDLTYVKMRAGNEDLIDGEDSVHLFKPTKESTNTISLDETDHKYFITSSYSSVFAPNEIIVKNPNNEGTVYTGKAKDLDSYQAIPATRTEYISGLTSNAQAALVAGTMLQNLRSYYNGFSAKVPMCFGLDLYDRPTLNSPRTKQTQTGNLGTIKRVYSPMKSEPQYYMEIQAGKWNDPRATWDVMGIGAGFVNTQEENQYTYIFVPATAYASLLGDTDLWFCFSDPSSDIYNGMFSSDALADGSWVKYKIKAPSGSYKMRFGFRYESKAGILKIYIDDALAVTQNQYGVSGTYSEVEKSITIAKSTSDWHEFKFIVDGTSGTHYRVSWSDFVLYPF